MLRKLNMVFFLLLLCNNTALAFTFKIATLSSNGSVWMESMRAGAKKIKEKTDNRVSFKFYPGGVMGGDKNILRKINFGQLHGTAMPSAGLASIYPDIQLYSLILKFPSFAEIDYVRERMDKLLVEGLEKNGLVTFGIAEIGLAYVMSMTPIHNNTDLQKQKAWAPANNNIAIQAFKSASITPIPLPLRDVLMGLQTGMINAVVGSPTGALALQWHTKIKYVADFPLSYIVGTLVLNEKYFNKLSATDQQIVREVMSDVVQKVDKQSRKDNINATAALKSQGIEFIAVDKKAADELKSVMADANQKIVANGGLSADLVKQLDAYLVEFAAQK